MIVWNSIFTIFMDFCVSAQTCSFHKCLFKIDLIEIVFNIFNLKL